MKNKFSFYRTFYYFSSLKALYFYSFKRVKPKSRTYTHIQQIDSQNVKIFIITLESHEERVIFHASSNIHPSYKFHIWINQNSCIQHGLLTSCTYQPCFIPSHIQCAFSHVNTKELWKKAGRACERSHRGKIRSYLNLSSYVSISLTLSNNVILLEETLSNFVPFVTWVSHFFEREQKCGRLETFSFLKS